MPIPAWSCRSIALRTSFLTLALLSAGCDFSQRAAPSEPAGTPPESGTGGRSLRGSGGAAGAGTAGSTGAGAGGSEPSGGSGGSGGSQDAQASSPDLPLPSPSDGATAPPPSPDSGPDPAPASPYPAGPYGFKVGNIMANVALTDRAGATVTLQQLRTQAGAKVLLWSSGAEWCPACKGEVRKLKALHAQKAAQGLVIVESLHQSFDFKPANGSALTRWDQTYQVNYLLTYEKSPPYEPRANNPVVWLMDARTMKILSRESHAEGDVNAAVNAALAATK